MAKIDEITEILVTEIEAFNKSVDKLQKERQEFQNIKFTPDMAPINDAFKSNIEVIQKYNQEHRRILVGIQNNLKKTVIIPKWMTVSFISFFVFIILNLSYSFYQHQKIEEKEQKAYREGIEAMKSHIQQFFNENQNAKNNYDEWRKK